MSDDNTNIQESLGELRHLERAEKSGKVRDRIVFFRWLKEGMARNDLEAGKLVGISSATVYRLLAKYRKGGLDAFFVLH